MNSIFLSLFFWRDYEVRALRKKCPIWSYSVFSRIWTEYEEIQSISPHPIRMRENADKNKPKYEHFSHSGES